MTRTKTTTVTYQRMNWSATFSLSPESATTAKNKVTGWAEFPLIEPDLIKKEEDFTQLFLQFMAKEIFLFLTASGPATSIEDVKSWFKYKSRYCRLDGSSGFTLMSMSQVVINFQEFLLL